MAIVYGRGGAEKKLLSYCPNQIDSFADIHPTYQSIKNKIVKKRQEFNNNLPNEIREESNLLENNIQQKNETENSWDKKIVEKESIIHNKKVRLKKKFKSNMKYLVSLPFDYIGLFVDKKISKPSAIKEHQVKINENELIINELKSMPGTVFKRRNSDIIDKKEVLHQIINLPDYSGAKGEDIVLNELKKLSDDFYVICDITLQSDKYITYKKVKNLRTAQVDFVVIGPTGIYVIEVKNWSKSFYYNYQGFSPHEQVDRAALLFYVNLKTNFNIGNRTKKVLVTINDVIKYDYQYPSVYVLPETKIVNHIRKGKSNLPSKKYIKVAKFYRRLLGEN